MSKSAGWSWVSGANLYSEQSSNGRFSSTQQLDEPVKPFDPMQGRVATGKTFATLGDLPSGNRNDPVNATIGSMFFHRL
jgi:hypothetical protein